MPLPADVATSRRRRRRRNFRNGSSRHERGLSDSSRIHPHRPDLTRVSPFFPGAPADLRGSGSLLPAASCVGAGLVKQRTGRERVGKSGGRFLKGNPPYGSLLGNSRGAFFFEREHFFVFSPVGFNGNLSLLEIFVFTFSRGLEQMEEALPMGEMPVGFRIPESQPKMFGVPPKNRHPP